MTSGPFIATCTALVTLRVTSGTAETGTRLEYRWEATIYTVDGDDLVDVQFIRGTIHPRSIATEAMLYGAARKQVREALAQDAGSDDLTVTWWSIRALEGHRGVSLQDANGIRAAQGALFWNLVGVEPEDIPSDRSLPAVGLVDLQVVTR